MKENGKVKFIYSWPIIILALFIFWPVGLILIIKRTSIDKKYALGGGKVIRFLGIFSLVIAIVGLIANITAGFTPNDLILIVFFGIAGIALCMVANRNKKRANSIREYLSIIVNGQVRKLDTIVLTTGKPYDVVKKDIQMMIRNGYLKSAYIDESSREVVLPGSVSAKTTSATTTTAQNSTTRVVSCPCCGANNTIVGSSGECEYCGSPIE